MKQPDKEVNEAWTNKTERNKDDKNVMYELYVLTCNYFVSLFS